MNRIRGEVQRLADNGSYRNCWDIIHREMRQLAEIVRDARLKRCKGQGSLLLPSGEITEIINSGNTRDPWGNPL